MSGEQNKIRRQNQQNNVQKRLNERFKRLDKKRVRKKPSHTQIYPSNINDNILSNASGITKSDGNIIVSKKKKKKTVLQRSKTMHHSNSSSNDQKQAVPINSFKRKHKFNSPKSDINNDINGNRSRSNSVSVKEYLSDGEINQIMSNKIQTRKHSSSLTNRKSYFTKGNNKYTTNNNNNNNNNNNSNGRHTISFTNNTSENNILLYKSMININENIEIDEYKEEKKEKEKEKEHRSSTSDGLTKIKLSRPNSVPQPRPSVFDVTKRFMSTIIKTNIEEEEEEEEEEQEEYDSSSSNSSNSSNSSSSSIIVLAINIQCTVISAHKYRDNNVEYEIEVTYLNKQWVLYKKFKDFYDLNSSLKRKYKHIKLPTLPTRARILNTMSSKSILERKENFNNYLQLILKIKEICKCNLLLYFLKIKGDKIHDKYNISIWNKSNYNYNNESEFDCHYILQLRFSCRNIPIDCINNGCLLKILSKNINGCWKIIMNTDFIIDNKHPKFCKTLLYNYYPTNNNNIKIELLDNNNNIINNTIINIMYLLTKKYKGYLCIPFKGKNITHSHLKFDENPELIHIPCFIIIANIISNNNNNYNGNGNGKINKLLLDSNNNINNDKYKILPKYILPKNLNIILWTDDISNKLKCITTNSVETSEFRQSIKTNKKLLTEYNYFSTKIESEKEKSLREHIASVLLNIWKKCIDCYIKKGNKNIIIKSFKNTLLYIICKLANRFEFDLSHIKHWQHENINGFKALTTFQWERIMKQYYKLFIRTLEISLNIIQEDQHEEEEETQIFCKEIIGLSFIRMNHMHNKLLPLLVSEINIIIRQSKSKRYEFLVENYPDEDTEKGFMKHTWQEDYVTNIANEHNNYEIINNYNPFYINYIYKNPSINPFAWRWFAPPDIKNNKIQINTNKHKKYIRNNWQFIIKFIIGILSNYSRQYEIYWNKIEGFPRIKQLLIQSIIWTEIDNNNYILSFISELMNISEFRYCIGIFGKALIHNTNYIQPLQVEKCFKYLREWIINSKCDKLGLLPYSFCYNSFYIASSHIFEQEEWQIICVLLSFLLHNSRLFKESFRNKIFSQLLIKKYFMKLCCHWNRLVRKYYFMVLLYCINRCGYFYEERRKKCISIGIDLNIINSAHRCYVLFDNMIHLITKDYYLKHKLSKQNSSKKNLQLIDIKTNKQIEYESKEFQDEKKEMEYLHSYICDMKLIEKIENDSHLIELLNLQITQIKTKRKDIKQKYRPYIDAAFNQFANLCLRYKKIQLTKNNAWVLGEVLIPGIMYRVRDKDKHLNQFKKSNQESHKFVQ